MALASHGGEEAGATPLIIHGTPEGCLKKSSSDAKHCHDFSHRFSGGAKKGITKYVAHAFSFFPLPTCPEDDI
jgi:hypothetical protein